MPHPIPTCGHLQSMPRTTLVETNAASSTEVSMETMCAEVQTADLADESSVRKEASERDDNEAGAW